MRGLLAICIMLLIDFAKLRFIAGWSLVIRYIGGFDNDVIDRNVLVPGF